MTRDADELVARFRKAAGDRTPRELEKAIAQAVPGEAKFASDTTIGRILTGITERPRARTLRAIRAFGIFEGWVLDHEMLALVREPRISSRAKDLAELSSSDPRRMVLDATDRLVWLLDQQVQSGEMTAGEAVETASAILGGLLPDARVALQVWIEKTGLAGHGAGRGIGAQDHHS